MVYGGGDKAYVPNPSGSRLIMRTPQLTTMRKRMLLTFRCTLDI